MPDSSNAFRTKIEERFFDGTQTFEGASFVSMQEIPWQCNKHKLFPGQIPSFGARSNLRTTTSKVGSYNVKKKLGVISRAKRTKTNRCHVKPPTNVYIKLTKEPESGMCNCSAASSCLKYRFSDNCRPFREVFQTGVKYTSTQKSNTWW